MEIRKTTQKDIEGILKIYESARKFMAENGNPDQWSNIHPEERVILKDIEKGNHFVCLDEGRLAGCFAFIKGDDPTYRIIVKGNWLDYKPYAVIHRLAVLEHGKGTGSICIDWCLNQHGNIRIDTHQDNIPMQRLIAKKGFKYCGRIYTSWGDERLAFQKSE